MKRVLSLAIIAIVLSMPVLAVAVGPFDGAYSVVATSSNGQFLDYVVVLQNGTQIVLTILYPDVGSWFYGIGTLNGNTGSGTLFQPNNTSFGSFNVTLGADGSLSGTLTDTGLTVNLNGSRIF
jgi:hypothetical protein